MHDMGDRRLADNSQVVPQLNVLYINNYAGTVHAVLRGRFSNFPSYLSMVFGHLTNVLTVAHVLFLPSRGGEKRVSMYFHSTFRNCRCAFYPMGEGAKCLCLVVFYGCGFRDTGRF